MEKRLTFLAIAILSLSSCDNTTRKVTVNQEPIVLPHPEAISMTGGSIALTRSSRLYSPHEELKPLLELLDSELYKITGNRLGISSKENASADISFIIDSSLVPEEYHLEIDRAVQLTGGSYQALAMAKSTLLQLAQKNDGFLIFPRLEIRDHPDASYRSLMVDVARQWHDVDILMQIIDMAAFYKIKFVQLHLTDDQSFTFPSSSFPKLPSPGRHYERQELEDLVHYAKIRGVVLIPELEVPGHALQFVKSYPDIFGVENSNDDSNVINIGKEEVYIAIDKIIGEIVEIFDNSPYFHIGGDEARLTLLESDPHVKAFMRERDLGHDVHELFRYFIVQMNGIVKKHGKQMCVWEGFEPRGEVNIPNDIIVFEFETNKYLPTHLVDDGYTVVNTSWKPLYVVNHKKWEPKTIYSWNMWRWENWWDQAPSIVPIQLEKTPLVIGAQMCSWEQTQELEIPSLRKRLPAFAERVWNTDEKISFQEFSERLDKTDQILSLLIEDSRQDSLLTNYNFEAD